MPKTTSSWRERAADALTAAEPPEYRRVRTVSINWPGRFQVLALRAAKARGISLSSYARRAVMAFVVHDLGLDWDEVMRDESPLRLHGEHNTNETVKQPRGEGFGPWRIGGLR